MHSSRWHRVSAGSREPPLKVVTSLTSFLLGCRLMFVRISVLAACRRVVRRVESRRAPSLRILPALRIDSGVRRGLTPAACACHGGPRCPTDVELPHCAAGGDAGWLRATTATRHVTPAAPVRAFAALGPGSQWRSSRSRMESMLRIGPTDVCVVGNTLTKAHLECRGG